jgi:hypothetical protein
MVAAASGRRGTVTLNARKVVQALLVAATTMAVVAPAAPANHSTRDLLSIGATGGNGAADVFFSFASGDGARVFFETPESLVAGDTDTAYDIYQREGGTTTLISTGPAGGNGNFDAFPDDVSKDGSRVFFETDERLVAGDTDNFFDVYERSGSTTTLISTGPTGGNGMFDTFFHDISTDGGRVFFETDEQLVAGDTDSQADVYERAAGTTTLVSTGTPGNGNFPAIFAGISQDGTSVFFETDEQLAANDSDSFFDVYRRQGGTTTLVSTGPTGGNGPHDATFRGSSLDGARVFFQTNEALSASDTDASSDVYERLGGTTTLVSAPGNGAFPATFEGNSGDGMRVFFETREPLSAGDTDTFVDVYQRSGGTTTLVSAGTPGNGSFDARFTGNSVDGTLVFFETREPLAAGDTDSAFDVYERANGTTTTRLSVGPSGGNAAIDASFAGASLDGLRVLIETTEPLVATDSDTVNDVYERFASTTTHISNGPTGGNAAIPAFFAGISDPGTRIFFDTRESLLASDTDISRDVYVADVAGYSRPKSAQAINVALVPAYQPCSAPNRTHGPPLGFPSCSPPQLQSSQLTVGTPDSNGAALNASGSAKYQALVGVAGGPDDSDVSFRFNFVDVRQQGGSLPDYAGQLQATTQVRITDKRNGPSETESATGSVELAVTVPCATTISSTIGSTCSITTTFDALTPGAVPEAKRSVWELGGIRVNDGGADGVVATTPNTQFATQGVFVP